MKKKQRKLIIILSLSILVIIVVIFAITELKNKEALDDGSDYEFEENDIEQDDDEEEYNAKDNNNLENNTNNETAEAEEAHNVLETDVVDGSWKKETDIEAYYAIKDVVSKINENFSNCDKKESMDILRDIYSNYINKAGLDDNQFKDFCELNKDQTITVKHLYRKDIGNYKTLYYVQSDNQRDIMFVMTDELEYTVIPKEYMMDEYGGIITDFTNDSIEIPDEFLNIRSTNNNIAVINYITIDEIVQKYFNDYMNKLQTNIQDLYDTLDLNYRNYRFGTYEEFKSYIEKYYAYLSNEKLSKYKSDTSAKDNTVIYTCYDQDGGVYIFKVTAAMEYTLYLDDYTENIDE